MINSGKNTRIIFWPTSYLCHEKDEIWTWAYPVSWSNQFSRRSVQRKVAGRIFKYPINDLRMITNLIKQLPDKKWIQSSKETTKEEEELIAPIYLVC